MLILEGKLVIYLRYDLEFRLSNFSLDVASEDNQEEEGVQAKTVEICRCPEGYTGNSCEVSSIFYRI